MDKETRDKIGFDKPKDKEAARIILLKSYTTLQQEIEEAYKDIGINTFDRKFIKTQLAGGEDRLIEFHFLYPNKKFIDDEGQLFLVGIIQLTPGIGIEVQVKYGHKPGPESNIDIFPADFLVGGEKPEGEELDKMRKIWERTKIIKH